MKITCILTSYNRPRFLRQAIKSVVDQTYQDWELIIVDNSSLFNIHDVVQEFNCPKIRVIHKKYGPAERATLGITGLNINEGMAAATGDLFCFLCDDDYFFPFWFAAAAKFLEENSPVNVCYGRLYYSKSEAMDFSMSGQCLFTPGSLQVPQGHVDHNQIVHRRFTPNHKWSEDIKVSHIIDAVYFVELAKTHLFYAVNSAAVVKRQHSKNLQFTMNDFYKGNAEGLRE